MDFIEVITLPCHHYYYWQLFFYFQKQTHIKFNKKYLYYSWNYFYCRSWYIHNQIDYEFKFGVTYEATLHHDFYSDKNTYTSYLKIEEKMIERDLNSILLNKKTLKMHQLLMLC